DHQHQLVVTADEQPMMSRIERHSGGALTRCDGPRGDDLALPGIDYRNLILVLDIDEDPAGRTVGCRELRLPRQSDRGQRLPGRRSDYSGRMPTAVERIHLFPARLVKYGIRPCLRPDLAHGLEGREVDDTQLRFLAIAAEPAPQIVRDRKTVHTRSIRNIADHLACIQVDDGDVCAVCDIESARVGIDRQVVPTGSATDLDLTQEFVLYSL